MLVQTVVQAANTPNWNKYLQHQRLAKVYCAISLRGSEMTKGDYIVMVRSVSH
jgi:hypothetical protein